MVVECENNGFIVDVHENENDAVKSASTLLDDVQFCDDTCSKIHTLYRDWLFEYPLYKNGYPQLKSRYGSCNGFAYVHLIMIESDFSIRGLAYERTHGRSIIDSSEDDPDKNGYFISNFWASLAKAN